MEDGIPLRHVEQRLRVPMYRTNINCTPASAFSGPMVVSMRPLRPQHAIRAIQITSRFPAVHGAPVHVGLPELIGINDLARPDYGDPVEVRPDELPVYGPSRPSRSSRTSSRRSRSRTRPARC